MNAIPENSAEKSAAPLDVLARDSQLAHEIERLGAQFEMAKRDVADALADVRFLGDDRANPTADEAKGREDAFKHKLEMIRRKRVALQPQVQSAKRAQDLADALAHFARARSRLDARAALGVKICDKLREVHALLADADNLAQAAFVDVQRHLSSDIATYAMPAPAAQGLLDAIAFAVRDDGLRKFYADQAGKILSRDPAHYRAEVAA